MWGFGGQRGYNLYRRQGMIVNKFEIKTKIKVHGSRNVNCFSAKIDYSCFGLHKDIVQRNKEMSHTSTAEFDITEVFKDKIDRTGVK